MPAKTDPRHEEPAGGGIVAIDQRDIASRRAERDASRLYYRRPVSRWDLVPAVGIGVAVGLLAFYFARTLIQRTPLESAPAPRRHGSPSGGRDAAGRATRRLETSAARGG